MITVILSMALICFNNECYPALVGKHTPIGKFNVEYKLTDQKGYDGDILQFSETKDKVYAIHRLYLLNPKQHRDKRIQSDNPKDRLITDGCINVNPNVYEKLLESNIKELIVKK